jgi:hypothetical protein
MGRGIVILAIIAYLLNLAGSMAKSKQKTCMRFLFLQLQCGCWLLLAIGVMLVYNFTDPFMPQTLLEYLSLHAHLGIVGWFLLLVTGVGSRLIPMFLISKYNNTRGGSGGYML